MLPHILFNTLPFFCTPLKWFLLKNLFLNLKTIHFQVLAAVSHILLFRIWFFLGFHGLISQISSQLSDYHFRSLIALERSFLVHLHIISSILFTNTALTAVSVHAAHKPVSSIQGSSFPLHQGLSVPQMIPFEWYRLCLYQHHVEWRNGQIRKARGGSEDLTSTFGALCRGYFRLAVIQWHGLDAH